MNASSTTSDRLFKTDIRPLGASLDKVDRLEGVSYRWDNTAYPDKGFYEKIQIGLIAQDVEKVIPELVATDGAGYKSLYYQKLSVVLLEAVKELKLQKERQQQDFKAEMEKMRNEIDRLQAGGRVMKLDL